MRMESTMTEHTASAPRLKDARDLQIQLYREIGISAVAAALRFTTQLDPRPRTVDKPADAPHLAKVLAA